MGKRQRKWAENVRDKIFDLLGRRCNHKGCKETKRLEFDLIIPTGDDKHHRQMEWSWRMSFYRKQLEHGNLQILCRYHNAKKQNRMCLLTTNPINEPF